MTQRSATGSEREEPRRFDHLIFRVGEEHFALSATSLRQILEPPEIVPVPNTPPHLLGLINLRGEILAVLDLRVLFDLTPADSHDDDRLIVVRHGRRSVAIVADQVISIEALDHSRFESVPLDLPELHRRAFLGQYRLASGTSVSILDSAAIFTLPNFQVSTRTGPGRPHG